MNIPCFLIPIIVGLISALLGYLLGKMLSGGSDLNLKSQLDSSIETNKKLNQKISLLENDLSSKSSIGSNSLQADLDSCHSNSVKLKSTISSLEAELASLKSKNSTSQSFTSSEILIPFDSALALSIFGKKIKADDLKIVEGIGPKIEQLYHEAGIKTWKSLSETSIEKSQAILDEAGDRYNIHNPGTWANQSLLAYQGKWKELKEWQDSHKGGKA